MTRAIPEANWASRPIGRDAFISRVRTEGQHLYRDLPWRNIDDPYGVLVSEVMLQQTQVARVLRYWERWMALFPTVDALAAADVATVLEQWQGLGYNRRALALKHACEQCSQQYAGALPQSFEELVALPGIGPATAAGIMAFAYQKPADYVETNVRSVFLHELFPDADDVPDKELAPYVHDACDVADPRGWYYALLDYGAHLKSQGVNPARRSRHYARQSTFEGSHRQKRSFLLREVLAAPDGMSLTELAQVLNASESEAGRNHVETDAVEALVRELAEEGFFAYENGRARPR